MDAKLRKKLNDQLQYLVTRAAHRIPPGPRRLAVVWECCKQLYDRAKSDPEKRYWRDYLRQLQAKAEDMKREADARDAFLDPVVKRRLAKAWRFS